MKKRFFALFLVITLALALAPFASASEGNAAKDAADTLYTLGLFKGTGTDADGHPIYELDRAPRREEALVMLIRLLGLEADALATTAIHPFTDVPGWLSKYAAYAYDKGLTKGVSATQFGGGATATPNMYITFVLRALKYSDGGADPDFTYDKACEYSDKIGLTNGEYSAASAFNRGDVALISESALGQGLKTTGKSLLGALIEQGAVTRGAAEKAGLIPAKEWVTEARSFTMDAVAEPNGALRISVSTLKSKLPEAVAAISAGNMSYVPRSDKYSFDEMLALNSLFHLNYPSAIQLEQFNNQDYFLNGYGAAIFDNNNNFIAQVERIEGSNQVTVYTDFNVNTQKLNADLDRVLSTIAANTGRNTFAFSPEGYDGSHNGLDFYYIHPVMMNGKYVDDRDGVYFTSVYSGGDIMPESYLRNIKYHCLFNTFFCSDYSFITADGKNYNPYLDGSNYNILSTSDTGYKLENPAYLKNPPAEKGVPVPVGSGHHYTFVFHTRSGEYLGEIYAPPNS